MAYIKVKKGYNQIESMLPAGVITESNGLGGLEVEYQGNRVGWIHGDQNGWRAYTVANGSTGTKVGQFNTQREAVRSLLPKAEWGSVT